MNLISRLFLVSIMAGLAFTSGTHTGGAQEAKDVRFTKHVLTRDFVSEGVAVGDVNKDGRTDILAGAYWFEAPDWTPHEISEPQTFSAEKEYSNSFLNFTMDVNLDGWEDVIRIGFPGKPAHWLENPQGADQHWDSHLIHTSVCNESPRFVDVDGNGRMDLLFSDADGGRMTWFRPPTTPGEGDWQRFSISTKGAPGTRKFSHGLGFGNVNDDGREDVFVRKGWWEAPSDPHSSNWTFHEANLGPAHAQMYAYDFDADGDTDVAASSAHDYGLWWYEQEKTAQGQRTWTQHLISDEFSQAHALASADVDADGDPDLVTGKRYLAHNGHDPGSREPAVLYWFEFAGSERGQPSWTRHRIDANSGVGLHLVTQDVTGDDKMDIVVANKKGVFFFEQK